MAVRRYKRKNPLQAELRALRLLVQFAEQESREYPTLVIRKGHALHTVASSTLKAWLTLTDTQVDDIRKELRDVLRALAAGESVRLQPACVQPTVVKHRPLTSGRRRGNVYASATVSGHPRDVLVIHAWTTLTSGVPLQRLQLCPADVDEHKCGKAFVKMTQKRFCSARCQSRMYMRRMRDEQRREREAFMKKERRRR